ncbi:MAG: sugar transferase [Planctomycetota bacterium]
MLPHTSNVLPAQGRLATAGSGLVRTIWGLEPVQVHARYWASRGVCVVRSEDTAPAARGADLYLLLQPESLPLFDLTEALRVLNWVEPTVLTIRLQEKRDDGYREVVVCEGDEPHLSNGRRGNAADDRFVRFDRVYDGKEVRLGKAILTPDREIAQLWQQAGDPLSARRRLRRYVPAEERAVVRTVGRLYDRGDDREIALMMQDLVREWDAPDRTVSRIVRHTRKRSGGKATGATTVWTDKTAAVDDVDFLGQVWVGAGRELSAGTTVVGPRVVWDDPAKRPEDDDLGEVAWTELMPQDAHAVPVIGRAGRARIKKRLLSLSPNRKRNGKSTASGDGVVPLASVTQASTKVPMRRPDTVVPSNPGEFSEAAKRLFDIGFAVCALLATAPAWPVIMFLIWREDGRPFFFGHVRQSRGGKQFKCWKFRSMFNNAEEIKKRLIAEGLNEADGAQFFMENDPRITRIGNFLRKTNLDELPQFWNVLRGHMSIVGPRPSPDKENQFAPTWREARLSVRPGITGLWQIRRTRAEGTDFQEWVKYDLEYIEKRSFRGDLVLIFKTVAMMFRKIARS